MVTGLDLYTKYGNPFTTYDEGQYMELWQVPKYIHSRIRVLPSRIYCNKELPLMLEIAFLNLIDRGFSDELKTWDGCYMIRPIRGYERLVEELMGKGNIEAAMIYLSVHSWGFGIDVNAFENGLGKIPKFTNGFVKCFTDAGFEWGGKWKRKDGMHFQPEYIRP
jgi:hypothetical protein